MCWYQRLRKSVRAQLKWCVTILRTFSRSTIFRRNHLVVPCLSRTCSVSLLTTRCLGFDGTVPSHHRGCGSVGWSVLLPDDERIGDGLMFVKSRSLAFANGWRSLSHHGTASLVSSNDDRSCLRILLSDACQISADVSGECCMIRSSRSDNGSPCSVICAFCSMYSIILIGWCFAFPGFAPARVKHGSHGWSARRLMDFVQQVFLVAQVSSFRPIGEIR